MKAEHRVALAVVLGLVVTATACGDGSPGSEDSGVETPSAVEEAPTDATPDPTPSAVGVEGCGREAVSDPGDGSSDRSPARCETGAPAPIPLEQRATLVLANAFQSEYVAPIILAQSEGEFERENLEVVIEPLTMEDALTQMATGRIDAVNGAPNASWFNAHAGDIDVKWVLGNFYPPNAGDPDVPQTGLWARRSVLNGSETPDLKDLEGRTIGSATGLGSAISYPVSAAFDEAGVDASTISYETMPPSDILVALQNGAVDAAWILDPFWTELEGSQEYELLVTQPPGEPLGGIFFAADFLESDREVALAFTRAIIRTINTHVPGDYHDDDEVMNSIAAEIGVEVDTMLRIPSLVFDWEIRDGTTDRVQEAFFGYDVLSIDEPLPEADLVDRSLYQEVVGQ